MRSKLAPIRDRQEYHERLKQSFNQWAEKSLVQRKADSDALWYERRKFNKTGIRTIRQHQEKQHGDF